MADGLTDVIAELHVIDPVDLVSYIHFGRFASLEDLLQSATELYFREGTLTFGWTATVDMAWGDMPTVTLGMEFTNKMVTVFFDLSLHAMERAVEVASVMFDPACRDPAARLSHVADAMADARLPKRIDDAKARHPRDGHPLRTR